MGKQQKQWDSLFLGVPKSLQMVIAAMKLKTFAPWKNSYDEPRQHIKKQRHYFSNKGPSSQSYGFSSSHVWMWETIRKAVCQRTDGFELQCWRGLLRILWAARRPNKSILNEISPEYSLEGLMLKLRYFSHLMWRPDSLEKTLMLGKLKAGGGGDDRGWDGWMASPTQWTWVSANSRRWWRTRKPGMLQSMGSQRVGHHWVTEQQQ